jgi:hypothetical protein
MIRRARVFKLLAYAVAGPITGPLAAGVVRHFRKDPWLSALYVWALVLTWIDLPLIAHALLRHAVTVTS